MGDMRALRLPNNHISGTIPSSWSKLGVLGTDLGGLTLLDISSNSLVGTLPPQLANISSPSFTFLSLRNNRYHMIEIMGILESPTSEASV